MVIEEREKLMLWIYFSETLLYLCFSLLMGSFIIALIPINNKPSISLNKRWLQFSILGIVVLSLFPIIRLVLFLYEDIGLSLTIQNVIAGFEVGRAWTFTLFLAFIFYLYVSIFSVFTNKKHILVSILFTLALILSLGWASHSASLTEWSGFIAHTLHFLAVTIWIGILIIVSWFSVNHHNWAAFLKWFTPVAIICLVIIIGTGLFLMSLVQEFNVYANSWLLPYGQALLIKHIIIIPIIVFASINGIWMRKRIKLDSKINPLPWVKAESGLLLLIFIATAVLGQQEPPHSVESTISGGGLSNIFGALHNGVITTPIEASFDINLIGLLFFMLTLVFLVLTVAVFVKKIPSIVAFIMSVLCIVSLYLGLMNSVVY
ncbi:CopD family protein [Psychrobacillus sp.]|uniref:copper resistance D family protein n=1 Tax=Psychrobacillus sp. TaxID=1871623 RepID=UPI0028BF405B|nr:CopD family protein [Psychrobacillus sp.]